MGRGSKELTATEQAKKDIRKRKLMRILGIGGAAVIGILGLAAVVVGSIASFGVLPSALAAIISLGPVAAKCMYEATKYAKNAHDKAERLQIREAENALIETANKYNEEMNDKSEALMLMLRQARTQTEEQQNLERKLIEQELAKGNTEIIADILSEKIGDVENIDIKNVRESNHTSEIARAIAIRDELLNAVDEDDEIDSLRPRTAEQTTEKHRKDNNASPFSDTCYC